VIGATCVKRGKVDHVLYALLDESVFLELGLQLVVTPGEVPDPEVAGWHRDLIELTGQRVLDLARKIQGSASIKRKLDQDVGKLVNALVTAKILDANALSAEMKTELSRAKYQSAIVAPGQEGLL